MELSDVIAGAIAPAADLLGLPMRPEATVLLLAIGLQESRFRVRRQYGNGPAAGFWQFERGGGVRGVLQHPVSADRAARLCVARGVRPEALAVWDALQQDDVLAAGFARLLLLTDPAPLPAVEDAPGGWGYYVRNWQPGRPHPETWPGLHRRAQEAVL